MLRTEIEAVPLGSQTFISGLNLNNIVVFLAMWVLKNSSYEVLLSHICKLLPCLKLSCVKGILLVHFIFDQLFFVCVKDKKMPMALTRLMLPILFWIWLVQMIPYRIQQAVSAKPASIVQHFPLPCKCSFCRYLLHFLDCWSDHQKCCHPWDLLLT